MKRLKRWHRHPGAKRRAKRFKGESRRIRAQLTSVSVWARMIVGVCSTERANDRTRNRIRRLAHQLMGKVVYTS